jgi:hypothetical protein
VPFFFASAAVRRIGLAPQLFFISASNMTAKILKSLELLEMLKFFHHYVVGENGISPPQKSTDAVAV